LRQGVYATTYVWRNGRYVPVDPVNPFWIKVGVRFGWLVLVAIGVIVYRISARVHAQLGKILLAFGFVLAIPGVIVMWGMHSPLVESWGAGVQNAMLITGGIGLLMVLLGAAFWRVRAGAGGEPLEASSELDAPSVSPTFAAREPASVQATASPATGRRWLIPLVIGACVAVLVVGIAIAMLRPKKRAATRTRHGPAFVYTPPKLRKADPVAVRDYVRAADQLLAVALSEGASDPRIYQEQLNHQAAQERSIARSASKALAGDAAGAASELFLPNPHADGDRLLQPALICLAAGDLKTAWAVLDQIADREEGDPIRARLENDLRLLQAAHLLGDAPAVEQTSDRLVSLAASFPTPKSPLTRDQVITRVAQARMGWNDYDGARAVAGHLTAGEARDRFLDQIDQAQDRQPPAIQPGTVDRIDQATNDLFTLNPQMQQRVRADLKADNIRDLEQAALDSKGDARARSILNEICAMAGAARKDRATSEIYAQRAILGPPPLSDRNLLGRIARNIAEQQSACGDRRGADVTYTMAANVIKSTHDRNTPSHATVLSGLAEDEAHVGTIPAVSEWAATLDNLFDRKQVRVTLAKVLLDRAAQRDTDTPAW
jgi:hypothetical protein